VTAAQIRRLDVSPDLLVIEWSTGAIAEFASIWLRDNRPEDRDARSGQRLTDIADLPVRPRIRSAAAADATLRVEWEEESRAACFDLAWLAAQAAGDAGTRPERTLTRWVEGGKLDAARDVAWGAFGELLHDRARRLEWLTRLLQSGIAFMSALPATEAAILDAVNLVGRVAETNYGAVFDVRSVPEPENLAYSDLGLGLHTDNPYREPVPGFQALHALVVAPDGGDNLFADGFALGERLREVDPAAFAALTQTVVPFHYRSRDAELRAERPLIELAADGAVKAVHYNSRSIAPLPLQGREAPAFYAAYRRFAMMLRDPLHQLRYRLRAGDLVLFDNQRILHGRTAFSSARHARHLRGCYLTRDSVYSGAAVLQRPAPERDVT
jgi:gamma-butyrobetaine dioxygenase